MKGIFLCSITLMVAGTCFAEDMPPTGGDGWRIRAIEEKQYGKDWPFLVEKGILGCKVSLSGGRVLTAVIFRTTPTTGETKKTGIPHREYALNGTAIGMRLAGAPDRDVFTIVRTFDYGQGIKTKYSIGSIIGDGLAQCK